MSNSASSMQGMLMQEFPDVQVLQRFHGDSDVEVATGALRVLLVSVPVADPFADTSSSTGKSIDEFHDPNDLWLALEVGPDFSLPVKASQTVVPDRQNNTYTIPSLDVPGAALVLKIKSTDRDAIRQFEDLLIDYCAFPSEKKGQGSLELLDEKGQLLGTIDGPWKLTEDPDIHKPGREKDPVLFELPDQDNPTASGSNQQVLVHAAPRDENGQLPESYQNDWMLRKAQFLSTSLQKGSAWAGNKMLKGADAYVARTTPPTSNRTSIDTGMKRGSFSEKAQSDMQLQQSAAPSNLTGSGHQVVTFSPQTQNAALKIRDASGKVCSVSNRTTAALLNAAGNLGNQIGKKTGIQQRTTEDGKTETPKGIRGTFNRTLVAANLVLDGLTNSAERLIKDGGAASGRMIEHRYGSEAKVISGNVASVGRSAFVVYKDINGVRRKALLKVATGTIKARAPDGGEVILQQQGASPSPVAENQTVNERVGLPPSYESEGSQSAAGTMEKKRGVVVDDDDGEVTSAEKSILDELCAFSSSPQRDLPHASTTIKPISACAMINSREYEVFSDLTTLNDAVVSSSPNRDEKMYNAFASMTPPTVRRVHDFDVDDDVFDSPSANRIRAYSFLGNKGIEEARQETTHSLSRHSSFVEDWCDTPSLGSNLIDNNGLSAMFARIPSSPTRSAKAAMSSFATLSFDFDKEDARSSSVSAMTPYVAVDGLAYASGKTTFASLLQAIEAQNTNEDDHRSLCEIARSTMVGAQQDSTLQFMRQLQDIDGTCSGGGDDGGGNDGSGDARNCDTKDKGAYFRGSALTMSASFVEKTTGTTPYSHASQSCDDFSNATPTSNEEPCLLVWSSGAQTECSLRTAHVHLDCPVDAFKLALGSAGLESDSSHQSTLPKTVTPHRLSKRHQSSVLRDDNLSDKQLPRASPSRMGTATFPVSQTLPHLSTFDHGQHVVHNRLSSEESDLYTERSNFNANTSYEQASSPVTTCFSSPVQDTQKVSLPSFSVAFPDGLSDIRSTIGANDTDLPNRSSSPLSSIDEQYVRQKRAFHAADLYVDRHSTLQMKRRRIVPRLGGRPVERVHQSSYPSQCGETSEEGRLKNERSLLTDGAESLPPAASHAESVLIDSDGAACILLSLGSDSNCVHEQRALPTERAQRAVRRHTYLQHDHAVDASAAKPIKGRRSHDKIHAKQPRTSNATITPYVPNEEMTQQMNTLGSDVLARCGVREFPHEFPKLFDQFPLWYRRFNVPTPMDIEERQAIFGVASEEHADKIQDEDTRKAFLRSCKTFPIYKAPDHLFDLYSPRWMRSIGREKEALCTICYEEGTIRFLKTKTSQYNYHLINQHGISPLTRRPFDPPVAFRTANVPKPSCHERVTMLQGQCSVCTRFVDLQSVRDGQVNVAEIYWWKHASSCHKRDGSPYNSEHVFVKDEVYTRAVAYLHGKQASLSSECPP